MRECRTTDDRLFDFVDGIDPDLEGHVESCEHCQEFLAELWIGELGADLSQPVLRQVRFEEFLREVGRLTMDVVSAFGRAFVTYGPAGDTEIDHGPAILPAIEDDEE